MKVFFAFALCVSFLLVPFAAFANESCVASACPFATADIDEDQDDGKSDVLFHDCVHSHGAWLSVSDRDHEPLVEQVSLALPPVVAVAKPFASGPYKPPRLA